MTAISLKTLTGETTEASAARIEALRSTLHGGLALPGDHGYDEARTIWNAMVDRRPSLVIRAADASDVSQSVNLAREHGAVLSVRGGGHQIAGYAVNDGGILLDLSQMRSVQVDPAARCAQVGPGATLGDFDRCAQSFGLATPTGINSTTGIAGLTLGGGFGWITRKFGMTIDNLLSAEVVTADGQARRVSATETPDLFWAIRGGGGNFGVVTSFEFQLHPVGPDVLCGLIVHPLDAAPQLLRQYDKIANTAADELTVWAVLRRAPPLPFIPVEWHGKEVLAFAACYCGDVKDGETALAEVRGLGQTVAEAVGTQPFAHWQTTFDPLLTPGARNYWKSHDFMDLSDAMVEALMAGVRKLPSPECEVFIGHLGGAMAKVSAEATAYPQRQSHFVMNVHTRWREQADDAACIAWARQLFDATAPYAAGSVYVNFIPDDEVGRVSAAYGPNMQRLAQIKHRYDPTNLFRMNHNIAPASSASAAA
ncbi:FAD-linked oxidase [Bradyrhizobium centrolobii]|uniref:FAD-linked oxidase n=1 Tax=Bradyrhizobium centrolobii TaxID=1505087 RepID=A0A176YHS5_9BRAD|nr:FAD-binding oxidoreductase [Bradyrhizobium centrolobii]OAF05389.1 FAD-linked oxidase [Bradyrhizobium centrolobii]